MVQPQFMEAQDPQPLFPQASSQNEEQTTSVKKLKMNTLTSFSDDRKKLDNFIMECDIYLQMNKGVYDTDKKKIIFVLSYIKDGTAKAWKQSFWTMVKDDNDFGSYSHFKKGLRDSFSPVNKKGDAITKMVTSTMVGGTADKYIHQFIRWTAKSGVTNDLPLIKWFIASLN